ncbi:g-protein coupled receptor 98 [Trichonephila clavipes]|nr:g-protein coupled receptor 98 [Trichonephila clavipes]
MMYMSIVGSSIPCERLFSIAGNIATSPGVLTFQHPTVRVLEGSVTARIPVIRVNGSYSPITVNYRVLGDAASPYAKVTGQLAFLDGVLKQEIDIPLIDDDVRGPDLNLKVELYGPSLKTDIVGGLCTLTIVDDDSKSFLRR